MRTAMVSLLMIIAATAAAPAGAYMNLSCRVDVRVNVRVDEVALKQEIGAERLHCRRAAPSSELQVHVIRVVKTVANAHARASAEADGRASGSYSDSCTSYSCSASCHTSGYGSGSCSDSGSGSGTGSGERETTFTVASAGAAGLAKLGYQVAGEGAKCGLLDSGGAELDLLKAIALVTHAYGEELLARGGADLKGLERSRRPAEPKATPSAKSSSGAAPSFDGRKP